VTPKLALPEHARTSLFRAIVARLRANPDLRRVVVSWKVFDGSEGDAAPFTLTQLPGVKVYLGHAAAAPATNVRSLSPMTILVELAVAGTNQDDVTNLWGAIEAAVFPGDGTMFATLQDKGGLPNLTLDVPGVTPTKIGDQDALTSVGSLGCGFLARTRM
jgi:hypothetical protein